MTKILEHTCNRCNEKSLFRKRTPSTWCNECEKTYFNFKALMEHKPTTKIIVTEVNKPNLDRMAEAFYKLLRS